MTSSVTVRFWAGARKAAGRDSSELTASTLGDVIAALSTEPTLTDVCKASSFLVDGQAATPDTVLHDGAVIDVLPPFAGG